MKFARKTIREYAQATEMLVNYQEGLKLLKKVRDAANKHCTGLTRGTIEQATTEVMRLRHLLVNHRDDKLAAIEEEASVASELLTEEELQDGI